MKLNTTLLIGFIASSTVHAASVLNQDPQAGGIGYVWQVLLNGQESVTTPNVAASNVGSWSWEDQGLFAPGDPTVGWTHTSNWAAVELSEAAFFTFRLDRNAFIPLADGFRPTDNFFPSFTIYSGWDNDDGDNHTYNNRGDIAWAEDLQFIGLEENSTQPFAEKTMFLQAGKYSIAIGSNAPSETAPPRQGYAATFSTSPVPEPSSLGLAVLALAAAGLRRRR